jgi:hypothetical protein
MRKRQPCDGCASLKQLATEIDDEPGGFQIETCFTCGRSWIEPTPKLHEYIGFRIYEISHKLGIAIARVRGQS